MRFYKKLIKMIQVNVEDYKDYVHLHVCNGGRHFRLNKLKMVLNLKLKRIHLKIVKWNLSY